MAGNNYNEDEEEMDYTPNNTTNNMSKSMDTKSQYSPGSKKSKGKKRTQKKLAPITLEDVFNEISIESASNLNVPISRILLTPRSAESVLKLGVNPEILKMRDLDSFWVPEIEPAVQRMKHEAYIQRRYETMKQCRLERKRIINAEFEASSNITDAPVGVTPEMLLQQQNEASSTLIKLEMQRIEKMQKRQEKELEQMIQFEVNRAKLQQEMTDRIDKEKRKSEMRKKQQEKRLKLMAEERRLRDLQKATQEEVEEENRRALAKQTFDREQIIIDENNKKAALLKKQAREAEEQRKLKHEQHMRETAKAVAEEQALLRERIALMEKAEQKKVDAIVAKQARLAEELRVKRAIVEKRIEDNIKSSQEVEELKKTTFMEKTLNHEKLRQITFEKQEQERKMASQELLLQEQRRRMILLQQRREEEKKSERMLEKFEEEEIHVEQIQEVHAKEHRMITEKRAIRTQMKLDNVQRVQRVSEYKRLGILKKIESTDTRIENMLKQKQSLVKDRRNAGAATRVQKEKIAKVMEEVRTNATKANKLITQALSGKISLSSLTGGDMKKRSKSAGQKTKKGKNTKDMLGLSDGMNRTNSAEGFNDSENMENSFFGDEEASPTKPYVSPYDGV
jgi:hypothetical protein